MKIRAPAKVNLGLRIVGKRQDGYHLLDTIMVPVSLYDEIHITRAKAKQIKEGRDGRQCLSVVCSDSSVPSGRGNLVYRAAELIMSRSQVRAAIDIRVEKNIPVGAGLGGGSSDAAATLIGLNRFLELGYSVEQLKEFGKALGADVPFFVGGTPARARGIGERLSPLGALPRIWAVIVYPGFPVTTAWVYRNFQATLTKPIANTSISSLLKKPFGQMRLLVNDLETVTLVRYPRIGLLKQKLVEEGAAGALMSGSGSAVFGLFDSRGKAARAFSRLLKEEGVETFLVRLLSS